MADLTLNKPAAGAQNVINAEPDSRIELNFPTDQATLERSGNDLVFHFDDGSSIVIRDFYTAYTKESMPDFVLDGTPISGEQFFTALNGEDLMPAAGPAANAGNADGGRFHEFSDDPLQTGVDRLDGLDLSSSRAFFPERDPWGGLRGGPDNNAPTISATGSIDLVESGVHPGGNDPYAGIPSQTGTILAADADGDALNFGFIAADGSRVTEITTEYGTIVMSPDGTYTYTIDNDDPDTNSLALGETREQTFTVYVDDGRGGVATQEITVTITGTNDRPELALSAGTLEVIESGVGRDAEGNVVDSNIPAEENASYSGKFTSGAGQAQGTDADHGAVLTYGVAGGATGEPQNAYFTATNAGQGHSSVTAAGTYGDLILNNDGSYTYTLRPTGDAELNGLHEGEIVTETFTVYVKDEHGAWTSRELSVNITGTNDRPEISHVESLVLKESGVQDGGNTPTTPDGTVESEGGAHRLTATGHVTADDVDNDDDAGTLHYSFANGETSVSTALGSVTIDQNGNYTYTLNDKAANSLAQGETRTETITVMVTDSHGATHEAVVNVTIYGTNDIPTLTVTGSGQTLPEGNPGEKPFVEGTFDAGDPDSDAGTNQTYTIAGTPITVDGKTYETIGGAEDGVNKPGTADDVSASFTTDYGKLVLDPSTGKWTYELNNDSEAVQRMNEGDVKVEHFTVTVTDEHGATSTQDITVTITGTNDDPHIAEGREDLTVREAGIKDGGRTDSTFAVDPGTPTDGSSFTVKDVDSNDTPNTLRAYILDADGNKLVDESGQPIEIAAGGSASVETAYGTLTVTATATDDGVTYSYSFTVDNDNPTVNDLKAFDANDPASFLKEHFQISVEDKQGGSVAQDVDITIQGTNDGPTVTYVSVHVKDDGVYNPSENPNDPKPNAGDGNQDLTPDDKNNGWVGHGNDRPTVEGDIPATDPDAGHTLSYDIARENLGNLSIEVGGETINIHAEVKEDSETSLTITTDIGTFTLDKTSGHFTFALNTDSDIINRMEQGETTSFSLQTEATDEHGAYHQHLLGITIEGSNDIPKIGTTDADGVFHEADGPISLDVTESGVGRDAEGNVVDKPGTPEENDEYTGNVFAGGKVAGFDVDNGHKLYFGLSQGSGGTLNDVIFNPADSTAAGAPTYSKVEGHYGSMTIRADGTYTYKLEHQEQTFDTVQTAGGKFVTSINNLNEGDTLTETFTFYVKDEHNAWSQQEITVTITGTNDRPVLTVDQGNDRYFNVDGTEVSDKAFTEDGGVTKVEGRVVATDADEENGSGEATTADDNHDLTFSLTGGSSNWEWGEHGSQKSDGTVSSDGKTITTDYGTLTIDEFGNYKYELNNAGEAVQKLGAGETVTETFTVRVMDDRGAWHEQNISFTVNGTNDKTTVENTTDVTAYEKGVWGDQVDATGGRHGANDTFRPGETQAHTGTVTIGDADAHDTHSLVFAAQTGTMLITYDGETTESTFYVDASGTVWGKVEGLNGVGQEGAIRLGTLTCETDVAGNELHYTFTAGYQGDQGLNGLPQGMELHFGVDFTVKDQHGLASDEATANITIVGTNDKPTIKHEGEINLFVDGVGRDAETDKAVQSDDNQLNPEENKSYASETIRGKISGTDADLGDEVASYHISKVGDYVEAGAPAEKGHEAVYMKVNGVKVGILDLNTDTGEYTFRFLNADDGLSETDLNTIKETLAKYSEDAHFTRTVTFQTMDTHGSWNTKDVNFRIYATNDKPEITIGGNDPANIVAEGDGNALNLEVIEDAQTQTGGTKTIGVYDADKGQGHTFGLLTASEFDKLRTGETVIQRTTVSGEYGTLVMNPSTGKYEYKLDNGNEAVQNLHGARDGQPAEELTETFYVTVRDSSGAFDTHLITVTIKGTDDAPVFETHNNAYVHDVHEAGVENHSDNTPIHNDDASARITGEGKVSDSDAGDAGKLQISLNGEYTIGEGDSRQTVTSGFKENPDGSYTIETAYGTLTLTPGKDGAFSYTFELDNDSEAVNALPAGATIPLDFTISAMVPGEDQIVNQPLRINIHGTNDRPFFTTGDGNNPLKVDDDGVAHITADDITVNQYLGTVTGTVAAWDYDAGDAWSYSIIGANYNPLANGVTSISGEYGTLTLNASTGEYTYTLRADLSGNPDAVGKSAQELFAKEFFTIRVTDKLGAYSDAVLNIDIKGVDDDVTLTDSTATAFEDDKAVVDNTDADIIAEGNLNFKGIDNVDQIGEGGHATFTLKGSVTTTSHFPNGETSSATTSESVTVGSNGDQIIQGKYGTLTLHADGTYEYRLDNDINNGELQQYGQGEKFAEEVFNVTATSGKDGGKIEEGTITINILGSNDTPVINAETSGLTGSVTLDTPGGLVFGDGDGENTQIAGQDTDVNDKLTYGFLVNGEFVTSYKTEYGTFQIDPETGKYTYTVDNNSKTLRNALESKDSLKDTVQVVVRDQHGEESKPQTITITINKPEGGSGGEGEGKYEVVFDDGDKTGTVAEDAGKVNPGDAPGEHGTTCEGDIKAKWADDSDKPDHDPTVPDAVFGILDGESNVAVQSGMPYTTEWGTLYMNPETGHFTFVLNNDSPSVQELAEGDSKELVFTPTLNGKRIDGADITITIKGTNDAPVIENATKVEIDKNAISAEGQVEATDRDIHHMNDNDDWVEEGTGKDTLSYGVSHGKDEAHYAEGSAPGTANGEYGTLTINADGSYTYELTDGKHPHVENGKGGIVTETFTVWVKDEHGAYTSKEITVEIAGENTAPTIVDNSDWNLTVREDNGEVDGTHTPISVEKTIDGSLVTDDSAHGEHGIENLSFAIVKADGTLSTYADGANGYGSLTIGADGKYTFRLNNESEAVQKLGIDQDGKPETATETFTIRVTDAQGELVDQTITVIIQGTNDAPELFVDSTRNLSASGGDGSVSDSVTGTITGYDVDANDTLTYTFRDGEGEDGATYTTDYGTFTIVKGEDGSYTYKYKLNNDGDAVKKLTEGELYHDKAFIQVSDGHSGTAEREITVTIKGANDAPELDNVDESGVIQTANFESVTGGDREWTGELSGSDHDGDTLTYALEGGKTFLTGKYGTLEMKADGTYTYKLTADLTSLGAGERPEAPETFTVTVSDGHGGTTSATLNVNIMGTNDAPVITSKAPVFDLTESADGEAPATTEGRITITDADKTDTHTYTVKLESDKEGTGSDEAQGRYGTLTIEQDGTYTYKLTSDALGEGEEATETFTVMVSDGHETVAQTITVNLTGTNDAPVIETTPADGSRGTLTFSDADVSDTHSITVSLDGHEPLVLDGFHPSGTITLENGTLTLTYNPETKSVGYTLTPNDGVSHNQTVDASFSISVNDGTATVETPITLSARGTANTAPTTGTAEHATDLPSALLVGAEHVVVDNGTLPIQDADGDTLTFTQGELRGDYGTLTINADGTYTYTLNTSAEALQTLNEHKGQTLTDTFAYGVSDGHGGTANGEVHIELNVPETFQSVASDNALTAFSHASGGEEHAAGVMNADDHKPTDADNADQAAVRHTDSGVPADAPDAHQNGTADTEPHASDTPQASTLTEELRALNGETDDHALGRADAADAAGHAEPSETTTSTGHENGTESHALNADVAGTEHPTDSAEAPASGTPGAHDQPTDAGHPALFALFADGGDDAIFGTDGLEALAGTDHAGGFYSEEAGVRFDNIIETDQSLDAILPSVADTQASAGTDVSKADLSLTENHTDPTLAGADNHMPGVPDTAGITDAGHSDDGGAAIVGSVPDHADHNQNLAEQLAQHTVANANGH